MCSEGERVTFNSTRMSGLWPAWMQQTPENMHRQACSISGHYTMPREGWEEWATELKGVISASLHLAAVRGDKQKNQCSLSGQFTTRASLSAAVCQSRSLKWVGNCWQGRCQSTLIALLGSEWSLVQHYGQLKGYADKKTLTLSLCCIFPSHKFLSMKWVSAGCQSVEQPHTNSIHRVLF